LERETLLFLIFGLIPLMNFKEDSLEEFLVVLFFIIPQILIGYLFRPKGLS